MSNQSKVQTEKNGVFRVNKKVKYSEIRYKMNDTCGGFPN